MTLTDNKKLVGTLELCDLPELGINDLHVRVDTGAATSSLHVDNITEFQREGALWVSFYIHPDLHDVNETVKCEAEVEAIKKVKSSTANKERRYTIKTPIVMDGMEWTIQITLTDRSQMTYLMLLGRQAMEDRFVVDPSAEYVLKKPV